MKARTRRRLAYGCGTLGLALLIGFVPDGYPEVPEGPGYEAFEWGSDGLWDALEREYGVGETTCPPVAARERLARQVEDLAEERPGPGDPRWLEAERAVFRLGVGYARCPGRAAELIELRRRLRIAAKDASVTWPDDVEARRRLYRTLYGSRAAVEEVVLQLPADAVPALSPGREVPSQTPSTVVHGVPIHSGDLLLSRGGAPTSAFIARGNDYPGNFSHVALVHVDASSREASVIESHIERGVIVATPEDYFADKKLRILVLRMRPDHPALESDPMLPHEAATAALLDTQSRHIPYDFAMDFNDPAAQFCSEVASHAYAGQGVTLWPRLTAFSSPGLARWMAGFGVRELETHGPSDLEYAPALQVVAEWHDSTTLFDDHVDNAIIDALLERADDGLELGHAAAMLPLARLAKAYSVVLNWTGREGPVPEGMSATVALRARWLEATHASIKTEVLDAAAQFERDRGYRPPYWELVRMARAATAGLNED